jgi:alpha-D-ribose 1-methylphosphonate 5-triphosphate diphosphatase
MPKFLPPLRFVGAEVLSEGKLEQHSLALSGGRIVTDLLPAVDLSGYQILPGIIDMHGDGFERQIAPRPTAPFPLATALAATDREAAAHGVTTAYLAQGWSWEGGHRSPDQAIALLQALESYRPNALTDLRIQLRAENHLVGEGLRLIDTVRRFGVGYVVFNDHIDEALFMADREPDRFDGWAKKAGKTRAEFLSVIQAAKANAPRVPRHLCSLADAFDDLGIRYGSHDDPDAETRERFAMIGARIAEFPMTRGAAFAAHATMCPVVMGAPNVVRGGSQSDNVGAADLIAEGLCDALVSDYHIPALAMAAFRLVDQKLLDLPRAWAMVSEKPAEILGLHDRGRLSPGLRADIVILNARSRVIEATISGGRLSYLAGDLALRFLPQLQAMPIAAE